MPAPAELPTNLTLKDFPASDGTKNWPTNNTRVVDENSSFDYYEALGLDDPESIRWRVQLGEHLQRALSWPDGPNYVIRDFPQGYKLFKHLRGTEKSHRTDRYLYGSSHTARFRSIPEFAPHAVWLFRQPPSKSPSSSEFAASSSTTTLDHVELDHTTCECKYNKKNHATKKESPSKPRTKTKGRASGAQSVQSIQDVSMMPVKSDREDKLSVAEVKAEEAGSGVQVAEKLDVDMKSSVHQIDGSDVEEKNQELSVEDIKGENDTTNVVESQKEQPSTVIEPSTLSCSSSIQISAPIPNVGDDPPAHADKVGDTKVIDVTSGPSSDSADQNIANKPDGEQDIKRQSHSPKATTIIATATVSRSGIRSSQHDRIFSSTTKEILFPISDGTSSKWPTGSACSTSTAGPSTNHNNPEASSEVTPTLTFATPSASLTADTPAITPNLAGKAKPSRYTLADSSASRSWLNIVEKGVVKQLVNNYGLDENMAYSLKDWPDGYKVFESMRVTSTDKRSDKFLFGSRFGKFRSAREFIPHAIWLLESSLPLPINESSSSETKTETQTLEEEDDDDPLSLTLPSSSNPHPTNPENTNTDVFDHSKCECVIAQGKRNKRRKPVTKMDDGLGGIRVILGAEEVVSSGTEIATVGADTKVDEDNSLDADRSGISTHTASRKRKGARSLSPGVSASAKKRTRVESDTTGVGEPDLELNIMDDVETGIGPDAEDVASVSVKRSPRKRRPPAYLADASPIFKKPRKSGPRTSVAAAASESGEGIVNEVTGSNRQRSVQTTVDSQYPQVRNLQGQTPRGTKKTTARPKKLNGSGPGPSEIKVNGSDHSTSESIFGPITFTPMTKLTMQNHSSFVSSQEMDNIITEMPSDSIVQTYFRPGELVFYSLDQPISGPSDQIQFWPAVVKEFGKNYMYIILLLGLPTTKVLSSVHPTRILPYLATQLSRELLQSVLSEDVWNPSSQFRPPKPKAYLKASFHQVAHYYAAALWQARKIFQSWGFGNLCTAPSSLPEDPVKVEMSGPIPVYYRAIPSIPELKRFPYLWWGSERLVVGDFLRLKPPRKSFQDNSIPNVYQVLPPSGPGDAVAACEIALEGFSSSGMSGASLRGVVMRVREFFVEEMGLRSDKQAWIIRASGMLYELADVDWTPPDSSNQQQDSDLPSPPKGYKFRAILPSNSEAVVTMDLVCGRFYPGILSHHILESAIASNTLNVGLKGLESLWALEGIVPGEGNMMFSRPEDDSGSPSTKTYHSAVWFGHERKRMKELDPTTNIDWERVKSDLTKLKDDIFQ